MTLDRLRAALDALHPSGWSVADAAALLRNLDGQPPKRETVRDWLTRDAVPEWVWPQLRDRIREQRARLAEVLLKLP